MVPHRDVLENYAAFCRHFEVGQFLPNAKWLRDMLLGTARAGSLTLTEIGRALGEDCALHQTEKRLSRGLNSSRFNDEALEARRWTVVEEFTMARDGEGVVIAVDYTDLSKPRANIKDQGMEGVCFTWDGSKGERGPGFPVVQIEAVTPDGLYVPVVQELFSHQRYGFDTRYTPAGSLTTSQNQVFSRQIERAAPHIGRRAWWVFDRGFQDTKLMCALDGLGLRWMIRMKVGDGVRNPQSLFTADGKRTDIRALTNLLLRNKPRFSVTLRDATPKIAAKVINVWTISVRLSNQKNAPYTAAEGG